ncbi:hypothetical protein KBC97_03055 [Candidatus Gracilibacteria bacterium]|nr:hypothetical protein [Candidatus Gracilibacteria bacterium]
MTANTVTLKHPSLQKFFGGKNKNKLNKNKPALSPQKRKATQTNKNKKERTVNNVLKKNTKER